MIVKKYHLLFLPKSHKKNLDLGGLYMDNAPNLIKKDRFG